MATEHGHGLTPRQKLVLEVLHPLTQAALSAELCYGTDNLSNDIGAFHEGRMFAGLSKAAAALGYRLVKVEVENDG